MFNPSNLLKELEHKAHQSELALQSKLNLILESIQIMSDQLDQLTAQVQKNNDLLDSATTLINGIADRITAAGTDPAKLTALTTELKAKDDVLSAAVLANTPVVVVPSTDTGTQVPVSATVTTAPQV